jgi:hypothetical protein
VGSRQVGSGGWARGWATSRRFQGIRTRGVTRPFDPPCTDRAPRCGRDRDGWVRFPLSCRMTVIDRHLPTASCREAPMSKRKLSDAQIAEIKRRLLARSVFWQSQRSLANEFGVSHCLICACESQLYAAGGLSNRITGGPRETSVPQAVRPCPRGFLMPPRSVHRITCACSSRMPPHRVAKISQCE